MTLITATLTGIVLWNAPAIHIGTSKEPLVELNASLGEALKASGNEEHVMQVISSFINRYEPNSFALTARTAVGTSKLIWASEQTNEWPISVDGIMGRSFAPILGHLALGECWSGEFNNHDASEYWVACGIVDHERHWGHVVATFDKPFNREVVQEVRILAKRLNEIILGAG